MGVCVAESAELLLEGFLVGIGIPVEAEKVPRSEQVGVDLGGERGYRRAVGVLVRVEENIGAIILVVA